MQTKVATGDKPDLAFWQPTASELTALNAKTNLQSLDGAPWLEQLHRQPGRHDRHPRRAPATPRWSRRPPSSACTTTRRSSQANGITDHPERTGTSSSAWPSSSRPRASTRSSRWAATSGRRSGGCRPSSPTPPRTASGTKVNENKEKFTDPTIQGAIDNYNDSDQARACSTRTSRPRRSRTRARRCSPATPRWSCR